MSFTKIWIHLVWATKKREPVLHKELRTQLFKHIRENAKEKNIYIDFINGYTDHVHILISLAVDQTVAKVVQLIKGESSYWINNSNLTAQKFEWQDDYFAVSVSESGVDKVREYIKNQEEHHKKKTFEEEYNEFMEKYGFEVLRAKAH
ncbi:MAG: IS200/IS605 family transposase [Sphingobacteriales bacterium]|nr:IS200/IS605 family transposase [Sphingobacteriales bacterium]MBI3717416.1 IS200/IS605 family transposase [Sphingobacteriales bacterium]